MPRSLKDVFCRSVAFSITCASRKCAQIDFAISRVIEKVVVVVVVMMRDGSLGSAERLDWENFREARLLHASSLTC